MGKKMTRLVLSIISGVVLGSVLGVFGTAYLVAFQNKNTSKEVFAASQEDKVVQNLALKSLQDGFREVTRAVMPSIVEVRVKTKATQSVNNVPNLPFPFPFFFFEESPKVVPKTEGLGAGIIVDSNEDAYYVITNAHVVSDSDSIEVMLQGGQKFRAQLLGIDKRFDLAALSFKPDAASQKEIALINIGDSDEVEIGDVVFAVGSPFALSFSLTQGIVSYVNRTNSPNNMIGNYIQTDAALNQGNSGGPLINIYGQFIGINTFINSPNGGSAGIGFAIPSNIIRAKLRDLIEKKDIQYGYIGIASTSDLRIIPGFIKDLKLTKYSGGVFIGSIANNGPANKAGMKAGDFIIKMDGEAIKDFNDLAFKVNFLVPDSKVEFTIIRLGEELTKTLTVASRKEEQKEKVFPGFIPVTNSPELKETFPDLITNVKGVVIFTEYPEGASSIIGFRAGDIITDINDVNIDNIFDFYQEWNKSDTWKVDLVRDSVRMSFRFSQ